MRTQKQEESCLAVVFFGFLEAVGREEEEEEEEGRVSNVLKIEDGD